MTTQFSHIFFNIHIPKYLNISLFIKNQKKKTFISNENFMKE